MDDQHDLKTKHPISVYSHFYSSTEKGFLSENAETYKGLDYVNQLVDKKQATFVMDRGYNNIETMEKFLGKKITLSFDYRKDEIYYTRIRNSPYMIWLLEEKGKEFSMVVVFGYSKEPMVLLTNKRISKKDEVLSVLKSYITRWRIEEMFSVQKQEFDLENIRVRMLRSLKRIFLLVSIMITFMALKIEKQNAFFSHCD